MKILTVISAYPPSTGGAQIHAHRLNVELVSRGHEVHVATVWRTTRKDWLRGTTMFAPTQAATEMLDGVVVHQLGLETRARLRSIVPAALYYASMEKMARLLAGLYRELASTVVAAVEPDVAHFSRIGREWFYQAFADALAAASVPYVLTPNHHPRWDRARDWWWWRIYEGAQRLLALSNHEMGSLASKVPRHRIMRTVIGPVASPQDSEIRPEEPPSVLFLGQVKRFKGLHVLYRAMRELWGDFPDLRLEVAGPWVDHLPSLRRRLARDPRVSVHGSVTDEVKEDLLRRTSVLCVPSTEEALGGVYLEAWATGRPAVGADIPPVRELFERTGGGIVAAPEPPTVAAALRSLLRDDSLWQRTATAGHRAIEEEYNWGVAATRTEIAYREATADHDG